MEYLIAIIIFIVVVIIISGIKIVPQAQVYVVERLGAFSGALHTGPHYVIPIIDKVVKKVSIKEQVVDFKPQPVITKDNVTMQIDTVVFLPTQSFTPTALKDLFPLSRTFPQPHSVTSSARWSLMLHSPPEMLSTPR